MPRYLALEEQYKFLKSLAKQYEHVQLKVVINENWENDDKNIARKVVITEIEKMMTKTLHVRWWLQKLKKMMTKRLHLINF